VRASMQRLLNQAFSVHRKTFSERAPAVEKEGRNASVTSSE